MIVTGSYSVIVPAGNYEAIFTPDANCLGVTRVPFSVPISGTVDIAASAEICFARLEAFGYQEQVAALMAALPMAEGVMRGAARSQDRARPESWIGKGREGQGLGSDRHLVGRAF